MAISHSVTPAGWSGAVQRWDIALKALQLVQRTGRASEVLGPSASGPSMAEEVAPCTGTTCAASPCAQGQAEVPRAAAWTQSSANSAPLISAVMPSIHRRAHQAQHALLALQALCVSPANLQLHQQQLQYSGISTTPLLQQIAASPGIHQLLSLVLENTLELKPRHLASILHRCMMLDSQEWQTAESREARIQLVEQAEHLGKRSVSQALIRYCNERLHSDALQLLTASELIQTLEAWSCMRWSLLPPRDIVRFAVQLLCPPPPQPSRAGSASRPGICAAYQTTAHSSASVGSISSDAHNINVQATHPFMLRTVSVGEAARAVNAVYKLQLLSSQLGLLQAFDNVVHRRQTSMQAADVDRLLHLNFLGIWQPSLQASEAITAAALRTAVSGSAKAPKRVAAAVRMLGTSVSAGRESAPGPPVQLLLAVCEYITESAGSLQGKDALGFVQGLCSMQFPHERVMAALKAHILSTRHSLNLQQACQIAQAFEGLGYRDEELFTGLSQQALLELVRSSAQIGLQAPPGAVSALQDPHPTSQGAIQASAHRHVDPISHLMAKVLQAIQAFQQPQMLTAAAAAAQQQVSPRAGADTGMGKALGGMHALLLECARQLLVCLPQARLQAIGGGPVDSLDSFKHVLFQAEQVKALVQCTQVLSAGSNMINADAMHALLGGVDIELSAMLCLAHKATSDCIASEYNASRATPTVDAPGGSKLSPQAHQLLTACHKLWATASVFARSAADMGVPWMATLHAMSACADVQRHGKASALHERGYGARSTVWGGRDDGHSAMQVSQTDALSLFGSLYVCAPGPSTKHAHGVNQMNALGRFAHMLIAQLPKEGGSSSKSKSTSDSQEGDPASSAWPGTDSLAVADPSTGSAIQQPGLVASVSRTWSVFSAFASGDGQLGKRAKAPMLPPHALLDVYRAHLTMQLLIQHEGIDDDIILDKQDLQHNQSHGAAQTSLAVAAARLAHGSPALLLAAESAWRSTGSGAVPGATHVSLRDTWQMRFSLAEVGLIPLSEHLVSPENALRCETLVSLPGSEGQVLQLLDLQPALASASAAEEGYEEPASSSSSNSSSNGRSNAHDRRRRGISSAADRVGSAAAAGPSSGRSNTQQFDTRPTACAGNACWKGLWHFTGDPNTQLAVELVPDEHLYLSPFTAGADPWVTQRPSRALHTPASMHAHTLQGAEAGSDGVFAAWRGPGMFRAWCLSQLGVVAVPVPHSHWRACAGSVGAQRELLRTCLRHALRQQLVQDDAHGS